MTPSRLLVLQNKERLSVWEKCSFAHRQVDTQPTKRSNTNNDKSAVAMLKNGNWQEKESVTNGCHDRPGKPGKRGDKKWAQNSSKRRFADARQLDCVFQDMTPPKSILRKSTDMPKPIQRVKFTKAVARHTKIRDQNPSFGYICPGAPHKRSPNAPKFEDRSQKRQNGKSKVPAKQRGSWPEMSSNERSTKEQHSSHLGNRCLPASTLQLEERIFCRFRCVNALRSAKRTWVMLKWILWRNRAVLW